jgi:hypothetical protein
MGRKRTPVEVLPILARVLRNLPTVARKSLSLAGLIASLAAGVWIQSGCIFSPKSDDGDGPVTPPPVYDVQSSPDRVLHDLTLAYQNRDSLEIKELYDSTYVGTSPDLGDPPGTQLSQFSFVDEVEHVAALARSTTISSLLFSLGSETSWTRLSSDNPSHPDWAVIQISGSNLDIEITDNSTGTTYIAKGALEFFTFRFAPSTPKPSSPTDTLWKIIEWQETRQASATP